MLFMGSSNTAVGVLLSCVLVVLFCIQPMVPVIDPVVNLPDTGCCSEHGDESACGNGETLCSCGSYITLNSVALTDICLPPLVTLAFKIRESLSTELLIYSIFRPPPVM